MPAYRLGYRQRAASCIEQANETKREDLKRSLIGIANNWVTLADELEKTHVIDEQTAARTQSTIPLFR